MRDILALSCILSGPKIGRCGDAVRISSTMQQKTDVSDILATRLLPPCSSILISLVGYKLQQHFTILNHLRDDVPFLFGQKSFHSLRRQSLLAIVPKLCWQSARLTQNYMQRYRLLVWLCR